LKRLQEAGGGLAHGGRRVVFAALHEERVRAVIELVEHLDRRGAHVGVFVEHEVGDLGQRLACLERAQCADERHAQLGALAEKIDEVVGRPRIAELGDRLDRELAHEPVRVALSGAHERTEGARIGDAQERAHREAPNHVGGIREILGDDVPRERGAVHLDERVEHALADPPVFVAEELEQLRRERALGVAHLVGDLCRDPPHVRILAAQEPDDGLGGVDATEPRELGDHLGGAGAHDDVATRQAVEQSRREVLCAGGLDGVEQGETIASPALAHALAEEADDRLALELCDLRGEGLEHVDAVTTDHLRAVSPHRGRVEPTE
jgi:hypothetical protein